MSTINLKSIEFDLSNIVSTVANITNVEYAIFNTNAELVSSTPIYHQRKGSKVHTASINEVVSKGSIVVNRPGLMPSCHGCRFVNNCPSTIEILSCIKFKNTVIGVISLTSFSQEGHNMINQNIHNYTDMLDHLSNLVAMLAYNENLKKDTYLLQETLNFATRESNNNFFVINENGVLVHWNHGIEELFSYCNLYSQTIYQLLPIDIVNWVFSRKTPSEKYLNLGKIKGILHVIPLKINEKIRGYILRIEKQSIIKNTSQTENYLDNIISVAPKIKQIKKNITRVSNSPSSVLITGDTGTGKEMIAKAIHYQGNRAEYPFIPINCASIPESLFESELFGYEEGSFTGARKGGKIGLFEIANGGTVFLDEIGELKLDQQAKLLRVLQENSIQRVGGDSIIPLNIRVIAATNQDLEKMVQKQNFRDDLYYRINVIPIHLPPLAERPEDIPILVEHFIEKYNSKLNNNIDSITKEALNLLQNYHWPGNIRELENTIEYAINIETSKNIQLKNLPPRIKNHKPINRDYKELLQDKELQLISNMLDKNGWDLKGKEKTAEELGISVRTLYRKLKEQ